MYSCSLLFASDCLWLNSCYDCMHVVASFVADLLYFLCQCYHLQFFNWLSFVLIASFSRIGFSNHFFPLQGNDKSKKENAGISLVDLAYRRAKAVKAVKRATDAGKITRRVEKKSKHPLPRKPNLEWKRCGSFFRVTWVRKNRKETPKEVGRRNPHSKASQGMNLVMFLLSYPICRVLIHWPNAEYSKDKLCLVTKT